MFKKIKNKEFYKVMSLLGNKLPLYIIAIIVQSSTVAICLNIVLAYIMKDAVNAIINGEWLLIRRALGTASISLLLGMAVTPLMIYIAAHLVRKSMAELRLKAFKHMEQLTIEGLEKHHTGDVISRLTNDIRTVEGVFEKDIPSLIFAIIFGIAAMVSIFTLEWRIGLIVILFGIVSIIISKFFSKPLRRAADAIQNNKGGLTKVLIDILEGLQVTKIFGIERIIFNRFRDKNCELVESEKDQAKSNASLNLTNNLYENLRYIGLLVLGFIIATRNSSDIGSVAAIVHLQGSASYLFNNIGTFISGIQTSLAGAKRVFDFLEWPAEEEFYANTYGENVSIMIPTDSAIGMKGVSFNYGDGYKALDNVSFCVNSGEVAAFVGPSGGGKSTILKLLIGFYPTSEGNVIIDGKHIGKYSISQLRDMIAYVPQDAYLFSGTIEENISYGKPDASREDIISAAKSAYAHDFILEQPEGYNTSVGERGTKLSGGQKQRIAIARALLKNAPILLLDEATSALDSDSEQLVQQALNVLMKGRTTIAVAHRLSTIEHADMIYVIDNGKVVEQGTHWGLVEKSVIYKRLYELQFNKDEAVSSC